MDAASKGAAALSSKDFDAAIQHYTTAISQSPQAVAYYIQRSTAYTRVSPSQHTHALQDAEVAVVLAHKRQKRELIGQAQLRRAIALFGLERYKDSKKCFDWVKQFAPKESALGIWEKKLEGKGATGEGAEVKEIPEVDLEGLGKENAKRKEEAANKDGAKAVEAANNITSTNQAEAAPTAVQTPPSKIRHDWYQTNAGVTVTLMAKGIPKDKAQVDIQPNSLSISFPLPTGSDYDFSLDPLFGSINPAKSTHRILGTKAEFLLTKGVPGQRWTSLEGTHKLPDPKGEDGDVDDSVKKAILAQAAPARETAPAYPTSSRTGPKNWDKISQDLTAKKPAPKSTKKKRPSSEKSSSSSSRSSSPDVSRSTSKPKIKPTTATIDDDELEKYNSSEDEAGGDPVNGFFKKLFKNADPDTKRAMMKSYQESNGTALSTNWSEVGKGKVETTPPDGMEAKRWGE